MVSLLLDDLDTYYGRAVGDRNIYCKAYFCNISTYLTVTFYFINSLIHLVTDIEISGFLRRVGEVFLLLGYYTAYVVQALALLDL
jgi:hypothetical protein